MEKAGITKMPIQIFKNNNMAREFEKLPKKYSVFLFSVSVPKKYHRYVVPNTELLNFHSVYPAAADFLDTLQILKYYLSNN